MRTILLIPPIFIPSKGRAETSATLKKFRSSDALLEETFVVVEPQEVEAYQKNFPEFVYRVLPKSNQGGHYVRQFIIECARKEGLDWIWMSDDDMSHFGKYSIDEKPKRVPISVEDVFREATEVLQAYPNLGQGCLDFPTISYFRCREGGQPKINQLVNTVCLFNIKELTERGINYRPHLRMEEDVDFAIQTVATGLTTVRLANYYFSTPPVGSNEGGYFDDYRTTIKSECQEWVRNHWGVDNFRWRKGKDGKINLKPIWQALSNLNLSRSDAELTRRDFDFSGMFDEDN